MNEGELLEQMDEYLDDDTRHLREQDLSEQQLQDAAALKAHHHYSGDWTEDEQQIIDAVSSTYQHYFVIQGRTDHQYG